MKLTWTPQEEPDPEEPEQIAHLPRFPEMPLAYVKPMKGTAGAWEMQSAGRDDGAGDRIHPTEEAAKAAAEASIDRLRARLNSAAEDEQTPSLF